MQVPLKIIPYDHPDDICNAAEEAITSASASLSSSVHEINTPWDIALIAADEDRAKCIDFTPTYCEIQATCIVRKTSSVNNFNDIINNKKDIKISVKGGGAYDLWITRNWGNDNNNINIIRSRTLDLSYDACVNDNTIDILAGLRPRLLDDFKKCNNNNDDNDDGQHKLLDGSFMSVQQSIGCFKIPNNNDNDNDNPSRGYEFLCEFVNEACKPGNIVENLIEKHGVTGRLSLPK